MSFKIIMAAALCLAVLSGCYESPGITYHEPGEYKGRKDPLLNQLEKPEQQQLLVERFRKIQIDR